MGVCCYLPLANSKSVHREVESGGKVPTRGTRTSSGISNGDEFAKQNKVLKLHGRWSVNDAGTRNESYLSYRGRSHGHIETKA